MSDTAEPLSDNPPHAGASDGGPLAAYAGEIPPAPDWFKTAVAAPYETCHIEVEGAKIEYQRWGKRGAPGLLLVHGNGAHSHWWDFTAPYFSETYNVAAISLSGMGDSDWREAYSLELFASEQIAVAEDAGLFDGPCKPIIVAHSFGGFVTLVTANDYGDRFKSAVIVDSPVRPPESPHLGPNWGRRPHRVYETLEEALGRFRLAPPQPCDNHYAIDYIARWSLKKTDDGWTWKFDPSLWTHFSPARPASEMVLNAKCPIAFIRGEGSALVTDEIVKYVNQLTEERVPFISLPHAYHHVMLDQPVAFVSVIRTLLGSWPPA